MKIEWTYSGYCRAKQESAMEFSIESEQQTSFDQLDCMAYDIGHDPARNHPIHPLLIGNDGISKKLSIPFLEPLRSQEAFGLVLKCTLPGATKPGFGYYISTLSFAQRSIPRCTVRLEFFGSEPMWVRVYAASSAPQPTLLKTLRPIQKQRERYVYLDVIDDAPGQSTRVYTYWRDAF